MEFTLINALGDQLSATPVIRALKTKLPNENIRIFEPSKPEIFKYNKYLNRGNGENGIRMYLNPPSERLGVSESYARQISKVLGWIDDPLIVPDPTPELFMQPEELDEFREYGGSRTVAINAHAHASVRRWPYFAELSEMLMNHGWKVYHVGSNDHTTLPCTRDFKGRLNIRQSASLLANVSRVVCPDTGVMHLAAAVGTPCVTVYGYVLTAPAYTTTRPINYDKPCSARCGQERCAMSDRCAKLDLTTVREVFAEVVR